MNMCQVPFFIYELRAYRWPAEVAIGITDVLIFYKIGLQELKFADANYQPLAFVVT